MRALMIASILLPLALGLPVAGCNSHSTGSIVIPGSGTTINMTVVNKDIDTVHVIVDGDEIGKVLPNQTIDFAVLAGTRIVSFRETGDPTPDVQGEYVFDTTSVVRLTYDPSIPVNFRVRNNGTRTIDVFVDYANYGSVQPGTTRDWKLDSGIRDVHVLERGDTTADYVGTFNINTSGITTITYP